METSGLPVQEIWDEILDNIESHWDLRAAALTCRAFVLRAQIILFRTVDIRALNSPGLLANRLAKILAHSPHLVYHIHALHIRGCDAETLSPIAQIAWSQLEAISFCPHESESRWEMAFDVIAALVSIPTLREISFNLMHWQPHTLRTVLAQCSPTVCSLSVTHCCLTHPPSYSSDAPITGRNRRPIITTLDLLAVNDIPHVFVDALDLSNLSHFKVSFHLSSGIAELLHSCRHSIQSLELGGSEPEIESIDFGSFPVLSHIILQNVGPALQRAVENSGTIYVRTICYSLTWISGTDSVMHLEAAILAAMMPMLQRVEVQINGLCLSPTEYPITDWAAQIREKMPQLDKRGILDITLID
ncbi:hypothetical protein K438DRAFT_1936240 [Mycena galopus ATCC 62051]|nr:hypothetical protein K438DRAFT_1936240 [Mycena galopus ATCC 62051]